MLIVVRQFFVVFMEHMPYFCKHKKHGSGWCGMECFLYIKYILLNLWMMGEYQAVFAFREKNILFVKCVFDFFFILRQNLLAEKLT